MRRIREFGRSLRSSSQRRVDHPAHTITPPSTVSSAGPTKAVFAHYMVGTITRDHARQDIQTAHDLGLDAFALNVGVATQQWMKAALEVLFRAAEDVGFKLFLSMDLSASRGECSSTCTSSGAVEDFSWILETYAQNKVYYHVEGLPLVSTFSSGGLENKHFQNWFSNLSMQIYFLPDFDDTQGYYDADPGWWSYWGETVNGLFSWESSWPVIGSNTTAGSVARDAVVMAGAAQRSKSYMMGLSPLQYKNAYGTNNYRQGGVNLPARMQNILDLRVRPDFVEFLTWNDMPESHYIAKIWPESNTDFFPSLYANQAEWDHTGWQGLLASFIVAFKTSSIMTPVAGQQITGAIWYKTILQSSRCTPDPNSVTARKSLTTCHNVISTGSNPGEYFKKPNGFDGGEDKVNWAVVVPSSAKGWTASIISDEARLVTKELHEGLNFGSQGTICPGQQSMVIHDEAGNIVSSAVGGKSVEAICKHHIYNMNYQVVGFRDASGRDD